MKAIARIALISLVGSLAFAGSKVSSDMPAATANGMVDVIVQYKTFAARGTGIAGRAAIVHRHFRSIPATHMTLPLSAVHALESNPNVAYVTPNRATVGLLDITTQTVNANPLWSEGWDGTGVGVAVIDSGVALKRDLAAADGSHSRVVFSESFVAGEDASDQYGHGTHVAGIVAANGADSTGASFTHTFKGVAPNANIINLRVLDSNGNGNESDVIAAIDEAIALKDKYNIRVINLSLGHPVFESFQLDPLCQAVEAAWKAGITVVVAAGNMGRDNSLGTMGYATINSPGNDPYVITVGAMNANETPWRNDDKMASYSSKGPTLLDHVVKPDLVAPGNNVVSLLASPNCTLAAKYHDTLIPNASYEKTGRGMSSEYFKLSGTSMATPVVAAAAALMIQENPTLTPDTIKARLMKTATKNFARYTTALDAHSTASFETQQDLFAVGAGYVDIRAALENTDTVNFQALSPVAQYNAQTKTVTIESADAIVWGEPPVTGDAIVWGESPLWSDAIIWGESAVNGNAMTWGDAIIWGESDVQGFAIIWGEAIVWGEKNVQGSALIWGSSLNDGDR